MIRSLTKAGVSDGTRTRDICDHNAALYQLSYTHRDPLRGRRESLAVITDGLEGGAGTIRVVFWATRACPDQGGESHQASCGRTAASRSQP